MLLWGDVRLGNLVFDTERHVTAVLDWDLSSLGPREMDLGWHFGLEFMMETLFGGRPPGFPGVGESLERYERRTATKCGIWRGTRSSHWPAPWPSTTGSSASPVHRAGVRTRWATSSWPGLEGLADRRAGLKGRRRASGLCGVRVVRNP